MDFITILIFLGILTSLVVCILLFTIYLTSQPPNIHQSTNEKYYYINTAETNRELFPSIHDEYSKILSVIVPSYNEEQRLPIMMEETLEYLQNKTIEDKLFSYEIIVVDDGSKDSTSKVALEFTEKYGTDLVRVLTLEENRGKGGAVRFGMLSSRGKYLLFADADGATKFSDFYKLEKEINTNNDISIVCGSRAHLEEDAIATRSFFRTILMKGFHALVWGLCVKGIKDTQCGFKLLKREAASFLFTNLHVDRWAFDVDLLYIAQACGMKIAEVPVTWTEIEGSKMIPVFSWIQMGKDLLLIRLRYFIGAWKIHSLKKGS